MTGDCEPVDLEPLLNATAKQDLGAFNALYDATASALFHLALRITQSREQAEEVLCDVYFQVWEKAATYDPSRANAFAWLAMLCRSRALDRLRKQQRSSQHETSLDETGHSKWTDGSPFPQDLLLATEQHSAVHSALLKLDPEQRQLLSLAFFCDYSHQQLSELTGLPLGTVKSKIRRSLQILKQHIRV